MGEKNIPRNWVREEVVILVVEYFRTKNLSTSELNKSYQEISDFLRKREEILTGNEISDVFRDFAGIRMQSGRIRCLDPETHYCGMRGSKLQKEIVKEYLLNPPKMKEEAEQIYAKYRR